MNRIELYTLVGETLHLSQVFELHLRILISIFNDNFGTEIDEDALILKEDKKTLGVLLKELKKKTSLDQAGKEIFQEALQKRNYIAHDFFIKNTFAFEGQEEFEIVMEKLKEDQTVIIKATLISQGFVEGICQALKIDKSSILIKQST
ncbi:MAG: hypothetical protein COA96_01345 [SAR86 cluster bacterium]|uniref:Uncharacterized protein n=1 Tax=SAR86 cluster bacterium TaxID=2030880 RepID=A0A2A5B9M2_9GAMM|nr:MAG: hypothetical protein COA96_01345 [SAR86 cluster bacterium]